MGTLVVEPGEEPRRQPGVRVERRARRHGADVLDGAGTGRRATGLDAVGGRASGGARRGARRVDRDPTGRQRLGAGSRRPRALVGQPARREPHGGRLDSGRSPRAGSGGGERRRRGAQLAGRRGVLFWRGRRSRRRRADLVLRGTGCVGPSLRDVRAGVGRVETGRAAQAPARDRTGTRGATRRRKRRRQLRRGRRGCGARGVRANTGRGWRGDGRGARLRCQRYRCQRNRQGPGTPHVVAGDPRARAAWHQWRNVRGRHRRGNRGSIRAGRFGRRAWLHSSGVPPRSWLRPPRWR